MCILNNGEVTACIVCVCMCVYVCVVCMRMCVHVASVLYAKVCMCALEFVFCVCVCVYVCMCV